MKIEIGNKYKFKTIDSEFKKYNDTEVEVIRVLTDDEVDIFDVGNMYEVKFQDGCLGDVFEDELYI